MNTGTFLSMVLWLALTWLTMIYGWSLVLPAIFAGLLFFELRSRNEKGPI